MARTSTASTRIAAVLLGLCFLAGLYRAASQSITTEEAVSFDQFVRPPLRDNLARFDSGNLLWNVVLVKRTVGLLRLSEFSFRLPSLLAMALYLWSVYRLSRRIFGEGPAMLAAAAVLAGNPLLLAGGGLGVALGLWTLAIDLLQRYLLSNESSRPYYLNLAGACLGLSMAESLTFAVPAAAVAVGFVAWALVRSRFPFWTLVEQLLLPAVVVSFLLLAIPLARAQTSIPVWDFRPHSYRPWHNDSEARRLVQELRRYSTGRTVRIGASPALDPVITFYRARYRMAFWEPMRQRPLSEDFDYYVLDRGDQALISERRLRVLWSNSEIWLAEPAP